MKGRNEGERLTNFAPGNYHRREKPSRQLIWLMTPLLMSVFLFTGCSGDDVESPQVVAQSFLTDLRFQKHEEVQARIWPETLAEMVEELGSDDLEELFAVTRVKSPFLVERIEVEGGIPSELELGTAIELNLRFRDGREADMTLRWGGEKWFVDLPLEGEEVWKDLLHFEAPVVPSLKDEIDEDE